MFTKVNFCWQSTEFINCLSLRKIWKQISTCYKNSSYTENMDEQSEREVPSKKPRMYEEVEDVVNRLWHAAQNYNSTNKMTTNEPVKLKVKAHGDIEELERDDEVIEISDDEENYNHERPEGPVYNQISDEEDEDTVVTEEDRAVDTDEEDTVNTEEDRAVVPDEEEIHLMDDDQFRDSGEFEIVDEALEDEVDVLIREERIEVVTRYVRDMVSEEPNYLVLTLCESQGDTTKKKHRIFPTEWIPMDSIYWSQFLAALQNKTKVKDRSVYDGENVSAIRYPSGRIKASRNYVNVILRQKNRRIITRKFDVFKEDPEVTKKLKIFPTDMIPPQSPYFMDLIRDAYFPTKFSACTQK